jgi:sec-independent protein translocase protein TatC
MPEPKLNREDYLNQKSTSLVPENPNALELVDHLSELRMRVITIFFSFTAVALMAFFYSTNIINFLEQPAPAGSSFFQLKPGELFTVSLKIAVFMGFCISLPVILHQVFAFMKPGLKEHEVKILAPMVYLTPALFWAGIIFAYVFIMPSLLDFLLGFGSGVVEPSYGIEHFINLELSILTAAGICFLIPVFILTLGYMNLISSSNLLAIWRYVVVGAFVISAVITPTPDPFTMTMLASALLLLYFVTVLILRLSKND